MITTLAATLLCLGFVVNVYHLNLLLIHHDPSASREFSMNIRLYPTTVWLTDIIGFVGDDYPQRLPLEVPEVKMVIEDSLRYPMSGPTADEQWLSLFPHGHFVHLGPQNISFGKSPKKGVKKAKTNPRSTSFNDVSSGNTNS